MDCGEERLISDFKTGFNPNHLCGAPFTVSYLWTQNVMFLKYLQKTYMLYLQIQNSSFHQKFNIIMDFFALFALVSSRKQLNRLIK